MLQVKGLLAGKSYETLVSLNQSCRDDLLWWIEQIPNWNGRAIIVPAPDLTIATDASMKGWGSLPGSAYQGPVESDRISLPPHQCNRTQSSSVCFESIYNQQILFVCPSKDRQQNSSSLHSEDGGNQVSSPVRNSPGTLGLCSATSNNFDNRVFTRETHQEADWESRHFRDSSDWKLNPSIFKQINHLWGPMEVNLFSNRLNSTVKPQI